MQKASQTKLDPAVIDQVNKLLTQTGEREKLKEILKCKLLECGWADRIQSECFNEIRQRGVDKTNPQELLDHLVPRAKALVPDAVKKEILQEISRFLESNMP